MTTQLDTIIEEGKKSFREKFNESNENVNVYRVFPMDGLLLDK